MIGTGRCICGRNEQLNRVAQLTDIFLVRSISGEKNLENLRNI